MSRPRWKTAAGVGVIVIAAAGAALGGYAGTRHAREHHPSPPTATAPVPPAAYRDAQAAPAPAPSATLAPAPAATAVRQALSAALSAPGLGSRLRATVVDVDTGTVLFDRSGDTPAAPASTAKLLTAAAVLAVHPVTDRITTRVVAGDGGAVVLVGGGDPTLTGAAAGRPAAYPGAARLSDLAAQLQRAHRRPTRIVVDGSAFTGPAISPAWAPEDVPSEYASAITAVMADGGRTAPGDTIRSTTPDLAAGHELAAALGRPDLPVVRGRAPAGAPTLATVSSAPFGTLVEQMLQPSDNVLAECLARQVAIAEHRTASFSGAAGAVRGVLTRLGVDPGAGLVDGSGLAAGDRVSTTALAGLIRMLAGPAHPELHAVLAALPVAAWSGTLADRYVSGSARGGAGLVRAKTGTLTHVSSLAGTVHDAGGRLLSFALVADRVDSTVAAESALDALVARLAACGCT